MVNHGHEDPDARYGYRTRPGDWALTIGVSAGALWMCAETLISCSDEPRNGDQHGGRRRLEARHRGGSATGHPAAYLTEAPA